MKQNEQGGNRKFILIEQSNYFVNIITHRLKKVAYSFKWKKGKPKTVNGLGVFFKYQKLGTIMRIHLENIVLTKNIDDKQLNIYKDYIPKIFFRI